MSAGTNTRNGPATARTTESARLRALDDYDVLSGERIPDLDTITELAAAVCDVPTSVINVITADRQVQIAAVGVEPSACRRDDAMCSVTIVHPDPVVVSDASADPRFADNPFVTGVIATVRFYASTQLRNPAGHVLGTLCVFDDRVRTLTPAQRHRLDQLAALVVDVLELRRRGQELQRMVAQRERTLGELTRTRDELQRSNKALHDFAGIVAHDLRNPLASIVGTAALLAEEIDAHTDASLAGGIHQVQRSADRMRHVIDDLLTYASVGGRPHFGDIDLARVAADVVEDLTTMLSEARAEIRIGDLPTLAADPTHIRLLLQNLLSNAVKFRHPDRPCQISIEAATTPGAWLIHLADNGIGIPADARDKVLQPFVRLRPHVEGTGIGLATCAEVVRSHHGELHITETPGGGTTVTVKIPRLTPAA
ncbi:GAF domain-containing sensor histidine kinase [Actinoplanes sp. NPDC049802]|uniref:GAF domain-containing sensor histidine kinase n=1 Tax=Actinoplanes sp. NPDC049802 TaxID=3154742 RepID=UPI0033C47A5F